LSRLLLRLAGAAALAALSAFSALAQHLGDVSPSTVVQQVFAGQTTPALSPIPTSSLPPKVCIPTNGSPCGITNLGQTFHYFTYVTSSAGCVVDFAIQGSYDGIKFFNISADANFNPSFVIAGATGGISAQGFFPVIAVNLASISNCPSGVSGFYSGTSSALISTFGVFQQSTGIRQSLFQNANFSLGAAFNGTSAAPFNTTGGKIYLICTVTCGAGAQFSILTVPSPPMTAQTIATYSVANVTTLQVFTVPSVTAQYVEVFIASGSFASSNASMYYEFDVPGTPGATSNLYREINSNTSTQLRTGEGILDRVVVNNAGSAWTLQIFDSLACNSTAIAGATAFTIPVAGSVLSYNVQFNTGLCLLTAGTTPGSLTVSFR